MLNQRAVVVLSLSLAGCGSVSKGGSASGTGGLADTGGGGATAGSGGAPAGTGGMTPGTGGLAGTAGAPGGTGGAGPIDAPVSSDAADGGRDDARPTDGPADGGARCNPTSPFGTPVPVPSINSASNEVNLSLSPDGLVIYFSSDRGGGLGAYDLWTATRNSTSDPFGAAIPVAGVNSSANEVDPRISRDGLRLFLRSDRVAANGPDIMVATRATTLANFGTPAAVAGINSTSSEEEPFLSADETTIYFESSRPGGLGLYDLYMAVVGAGGAFGPPQAIGALNTAAQDTSAVLTADGLTIYFGSTRRAMSDYDIFVARRSTPQDGFGVAQTVTELSGTTEEFPVDLSADGCTIYFASSRPGGAGGYDLYAAQRGR